MKAFCENCGERNPDGAKFCAVCGSPLRSATTDQARPKAPSGSPKGEGAEGRQPGAPPKWERIQLQRTDNDGSKRKQQHCDTTLGSDRERPVADSSRVSKVKRGCLKAMGIYFGLSLYGFLLAALGWWLCTIFRHTI